MQIVFNNAGFIVTGFFDSQPLGKHLVNLECNATAAVAITHHFSSLMVKKGLKGCVVFTSSASAYTIGHFKVDGPLDFWGGCPAAPLGPWAPVQCSGRGGAMERPVPLSR